MIFKYDQLLKIFSYYCNKLRIELYIGIVTVCILYMASTLYWANKTALLLCTADIFSTAAYVMFIQTSQ